MDAEEYDAGGNVVLHREILPAFQGDGQQKGTEEHQLWGSAACVCISALFLPPVKPSGNPSNSYPSILSSTNVRGLRALQ